MSVNWIDREVFFSVVCRNFSRTTTVLDIGCGIRPQTYIRSKVHICCEPFKQYLDVIQEKYKNKRERTYVFIQADWEEAIKRIPHKSIDTVYMGDVIEHLEKDDALKLLKATANIAKKQIIIFTPLGFIPQHHEDGKDAWGMDGVEWQEHRSGWLPEDFDRSWDIFACKHFHIVDNAGNKLDTPHGIICAIKTFGDAKCIKTRSTLHVLLWKKTKHVLKYCRNIISPKTVNGI